MNVLSLQRGSLLLGRYQVMSQIGAGGYGVIYKARQTSTGQLVAIKMLLAQAMEGPELHEEIGRFQREMRLIGQLSHPHIVQLIDSGIEAGQRLMVLEFVDGEDLGSLLKLNGPLSPLSARRVMVQTLDALSLAHQSGVIHRDLKPQNIMLTGPEQRPNVKVLDFGIAGVTDDHKSDEEYHTLTQKGSIPGTPSYMAPEQIRSGESSPSSDIYSLGLILLECLTGYRAVTGESVGDICVKQVTEEVPIPAEILGSPFGPIIERACQKHPTARFGSAEEMMSALELVDPGPTLATTMMRGADATGPGATGPVPPSMEQQSQAGLIKALVAVAILLLLLAGGIGAWLAVKGSASESEPEETKEVKVEGEVATRPDASAMEKDAVAQVERLFSQRNLVSRSERGAAYGASGLPASGAPVAQMTVWKLTSEPSASVYLGSDRLCKETPCEVELASADAPYEVVFKARGHARKNASLEVARERVKVKLKRKAKPKDPKEDKPNDQPKGEGEDGRIKEFE